jgi:hypothetical protein
MPRHLLFKLDGTSFMLPPLSQNNWYVVERLIREVLRILSHCYNIQFFEPYSMTKWAYTAPHPTEKQTWYHTHQGRDWFAMWIVLLYWMLKVMPKDSQYIKGICPTEWYRVLLTWDKTCVGAWESLCCAPLLQRMWDANCSGIFLHNPDDQPCQPSASWFDHCSVPVWYHWGC